ncbi:mitochondrially targeted single-stranded DNA binding protein [Perilla frutescens var. hirtella]|nr:mitochondrially targeted single-stranded DNA binding protein [Perilla frutescens var. frutescens]KAH6794188.1 mitochondrially targeted single-stranded DNA binding protein [Perilla frutescens var. hirtella]
MTSLAPKLRSLLRLPNFSPAVGLQRSSKVSFSTGSFDSGDKADNEGADGVEMGDDDFLPQRPELQLQGVDPRKGWNHRGVHRAILCGKVGQAPIQKILRNGRTVTTFTVGTGGMYDQRTIGSPDLPKPAQWHRIAVHNPMLGAYAVQQLVKNSSVYVEGDIETRVYNDSINGDIKSIPEICVRGDGRIRLVKAGESMNSISIDELREGLF